MIKGDNFLKIPYKKRVNCAVCGKKLARPVIDLPKLPLTEIYTRKKPSKPVGFADQEFYFCENCHHGQVGNLIPPEILYNKQAYYFMTSKSRTATAANDYFIDFIKRITGKKRLKNIIEIGCSDLYLINALRSFADKLYGVDPVLKGREKELSDRKVTVIGEFFEKTDLIDKLKDSNSLVISSHTLEHIENPRKMIEILMKYLNKNSLCIFQFPSFEPLIEDLNYGQIFHQHLHYFTKDSFKYLVAESGGEVIDWQINSLHWGTLMVAFRKTNSSKKRPERTTNIDLEMIKTGYKEYRDSMRKLNKYLLSLGREKLYGFGASLMLPILGYHLGNDFSKFECILDDDKEKDGLYYISLPVEIRRPDSIKDWKDSNIFITAYNTVRSVLPRVLAFKPKKIIFSNHVI